MRTREMQQRLRDALEAADVCDHALLVSPEYAHPTYRRSLNYWRQEAFLYRDLLETRKELV